ncbi:MAG: hypothetical protein J7455_19620 [Roseiflexus sp.]|nr:hypothetical protein [Roseiflexus sp.]
MSTKQAHYALGIVLLIVATIVAGITATATSATNEAKPFYNRLVLMAAQGDKRAQDFVRLVDALVARQGSPGVVNERRVEHVTCIGDLQVEAVGLEPFYLKLYNNITFQSHEQIREYIAKREQALANIVSSNPSGNIEVSISLQEYTPLSDVLQLKRTYNLNIDEMTLHLFVDGERHSVLYVSDPTEPDDRRIVDFDASVDQFEEQLWQLLPAPVLEKEGIHAQNTSFKVSWLRGTLPATDASLLSDQQAIMLVDPVSDILDTYKDRAVEVRVVQVPNLLAAIETVEGLSRLSPQLPQPTPMPLREEK